MKVLVYLNKKTLSPTGGPKGYCYNLLVGLKEIQDDMHVHFIDYDISERNRKTNKQFIAIVGCLKTFFYPPSKTSIDLERYDIIHFQSTYELYKARRILRRYKGIVALTSHTPLKPSIEAYNNISNSDTFLLWWIKWIFDIIDSYSFRKADYIIFPCPEAEEPYYNSWSQYKEIRSTYPSKFKYLLTGSEPKTAQYNKRDVRNKYGIPIEAFVVTYVGRHNRVKGYDLLRELFRGFENDRGIFFLVAGKEEPLHGPDKDNWIEVGWTDDPHSLIAASDVFVLPNRETFFDLILIEALSVGQIVVASNTGGNRFFNGIEGIGVFTYNSINEAADIILKIQNMDYQCKEKLRQSNMRIFDKLFSAKTFARNYISLMNEIESEHKNEELY